MEERIETRQYRTDIARLAEAMARRDTEAAQRDKENTRWQIGLWVAAMVVLGILIRWPAPPAP